MLKITRFVTKRLIIVSWSLLKLAAGDFPACRWRHQPVLQACQFALLQLSLWFINLVVLPLFRHVYPSSVRPQRETVPVLQRVPQRRRAAARPASFSQRSPGAEQGEGDLPVILEPRTKTRKRTRTSPSHRLLHIDRLMEADVLWNFSGWKPVVCFQICQIWWEKKWQKPVCVINVSQKKSLYTVRDVFNEDHMKAKDFAKDFQKMFF